MLENSQVWLVVTCSTDFELMLMTKSDMYIHDFCGSLGLISLSTSFKVDNHVFKFFLFDVKNKDIKP